MLRNQRNALEQHVRPIPPHSNRFGYHTEKNTAGRRASLRKSITPFTFCVPECTIPQFFLKIAKRAVIRNGSLPGKLEFTFLT